MSFFRRSLFKNFVFNLITVKVVASSLLSSDLPDKERPRYPATIINSTERNDSLDLAVLEVTGIPYDIQALAIGSGRVQRNANILIIGHPHTIIDPWSVSSGGVINYNPK